MFSPEARMVGIIRISRTAAILHGMGNIPAGCLHCWWKHPSSIASIVLLFQWAYIKPISSPRKQLGASMQHGNCKVAYLRMQVYWIFSSMSFNIWSWQYAIKIKELCLKIAKSTNRSHNQLTLFTIFWKNENWGEKCSRNKKIKNVKGKNHSPPPYTNMQGRQPPHFCSPSLRWSGIVSFFGRQTIWIVCFIGEIMEILLDSHKQAGNPSGASKVWGKLHTWDGVSGKWMWRRDSP